MRPPSSVRRTPSRKKLSRTSPVWPSSGDSAAHHVAPGGRVARGGDEVAPSGVGARRREKRRVGAGGGTQAVRRGGLPHAGGQADRVEPRPTAELQRHLVAELTVEPRDA